MRETVPGATDRGASAPRVTARIIPQVRSIGAPAPDAVGWRHLQRYTAEAGRRVDGPPPVGRWLTIRCVNNSLSRVKDRGLVATSIGCRMRRRRRLTGEATPPRAERPTLRPRLPLSA